MTPEGEGGAAAAPGHSTDLLQFVTITMLFSFLSFKSRLGLKAVVISAGLRNLISQQVAVLSHQFGVLGGPKKAAQRFSHEQRGRVTSFNFSVQHILNGRNFDFFFLMKEN